MTDAEIIDNLHSLLDDHTVMVYLNDRPLRKSDIKFNKRGRIWFDEVFNPACMDKGYYIPVSVFWEHITVYHKGLPMSLEGNELTLSQDIHFLMLKRMGKLKEIE